MYGWLNVRFIVSIVGIAAAFFFGWALNNDRWEKKHAKEVAQLAEKTRAVQNTITAAYVLERNKKDEEIRNLNTRLNAALVGLRDRPSISSNPTSGPSLSAKGCYPTELFREHAEFLIREAARADQIRLEYNELYAHYVNIKKALSQ